MSSKDANTIRSIVIGSIRAKYTHRDLLLKIVDVITRGSKAYVNVVYHGSIQKAELAAYIAQVLISSMKERVRLRKFTYIVILVSKTGSRRGSRFVVSLRVPKILYTVLYRLIESLRSMNINIRKWSIKHISTPINKYKISIQASIGVPEIDISSMLNNMRKHIGQLTIDGQLCVSLIIKAKLKTYEGTVCTNSIS